MWSDWVIVTDHTSLQVSYARPGGDEAAETNLYVSNLPKTVTEELLDIIFGKYGTILQKNILRDKLTGQPRGVAFIRSVVGICLEDDRRWRWW